MKGLFAVLWLLAILLIATGQADPIPNGLESLWQHLNLTNHTAQGVN